MTMTHTLRALAMSAITLLVVACGTGTSGISDDGEQFASVNGKPISVESLAFYAERRTGTAWAELAPEMQEQVLNELINIELLTQQAQAAKLDQQAPLKQQLVLEHRTTLADAAITDHFANNAITEEELRAAFAELTAEMNGKEYNANHILVETEEAANTLLNELKAGADFEELAKANSIEPNASQTAGSLGWFEPAQMVQPFADAVRAMEIGKISDTPVETQFGWHIIRLNDSREVAPPEFDAVRANVERFVKNQRVQEYVNSLREGATIEKPDLLATPKS